MSLQCDQGSDKWKGVAMAGILKETIGGKKKKQLGKNRKSLFY